MDLGGLHVNQEKRHTNVGSIETISHYQHNCTSGTIFMVIPIILWSWISHKCIGIDMWFECINFMTWNWQGKTKYGEFWRAEKSSGERRNGGCSCTQHCGASRHSPFHKLFFWIHRSQNCIWFSWFRQFPGLFLIPLRNFLIT